MQAYAIKAYRKDAILERMEVPTPEVGPGDVLVAVHAAGVNPIDAKIRDGEFKQLLPYKMPLVLGSDLAGVVVQVGADVTKFQPGDAVFGHPNERRIGTFAEHIAVDAADLASKPNSLSMVQAASVLLAALTAWQVLVDGFAIQPGQKVFIQAGSGGVGMYAIQLAKYLGAHVATTTSTSNVAWVKELGADQVIDYKKENFAEVLRDYDFAFDTLGGQALVDVVKTLKPGGKIIGIAGPPDVQYGRKNSFNWLLRAVFFLLSFRIKRLAAKAKVHYQFHFMHASGAQLQKLTALFASGQLRTVIDKVFPFAQTNEALAYVTAGRAKGKVVVAMESES